MHPIVIVGGGVAGLQLATRLGRSRRPGRDQRIILVDHNLAHVWKPMLHRFASGTATYATESISFAAQAKRAGFEYYPGKLVGLNRPNREIIVESLAPSELHSGRPQTLAFDKLIIATGSRADDHRTRGASEHALRIDDVGQAQRVRKAIKEHALASLAGAAPVSVVVIGGGATGVELAAELVQAGDLIASFRSDGFPARTDLTLVDVGSRVLSPFPDKVSRAASARLTELGVKLRLKTKVVSVDEGGIYLDSGERIAARIRVWTAGVMACTCPGILNGLATNSKDQILVRPTLRSESDDNIYALGDCAQIIGKDSGPLPTTAQVARQQAIFLAASLKCEQAGSAASTFDYRDRGSIVSLGPYGAYASLARSGFLKGTVIKGRMAQAAHAALYRMHQLDLLGTMRGGVGWLADDLLRLTRPGIDLH